MSKITCKICEKQFKPLGFGTHLKLHHKITQIDYYEKYLRIDEKDGLCRVCGNKCTFRSALAGYSKHCSNKCVGLSPERLAK